MTGYNDPKTTKPVNRGSGRTLWIVAAAILALLLLAWLFGLFGGGEEVATEDPEAIVTEEGEGTTVTTEPADTTTTATEPATTEEPAEAEVTVEEPTEAPTVIVEEPAEGGADAVTPTTDDAAAPATGDAAAPAAGETTTPAAPAPAEPAETGDTAVPAPTLAD